MHKWNQFFINFEIILRSESIKVKTSFTSIFYLNFYENFGLTQILKEKNKFSSSEAISRRSFHKWVFDRIKFFRYIAIAQQRFQNNEYFDETIF